jgi:hypothetical protein
MESTSEGSLSHAHISRIPDFPFSIPDRDDSGILNPEGLFRSGYYTHRVSRKLNSAPIGWFASIPDSRGFLPLDGEGWSPEGGKGTPRSVLPTTLYSWPTILVLIALVGLTTE